MRGGEGVEVEPSGIFIARSDRLTGESLKPRLPFPAIYFVNGRISSNVKPCLLVTCVYIYI